MKPSYSCSAPDQQRLKTARLEIEAVIKKHDLAGVVVLHTPGMTEFFYDIRPSYSVCWIDEAASRLRVRSKLYTDHGGNRALQEHDQAATGNMLHGLATDLQAAAAMFAHCSYVVTTQMRAEHTAAEFVPDPQEGRRQ